jgi:hypothetical protein
MSGAGRAAGPESTGGGVFTALATLQQLDPCGRRLNGRALLAEIGRSYPMGASADGCYDETVSLRSGLCCRGCALLARLQAPVHKSMQENSRPCPDDLPYYSRP